MNGFRDTPLPLRVCALSTLIVCFGWASVPAAAGSFSFSTGAPDGLIGTLSRVASAGKIQTETADDFILTSSTLLTGATFYGLIPSGAALSDITEVEIEFYHVFPTDSTSPPSGNVPTRVNSPADNEIASATRDSPLTLTFTPTTVNPSFHVNNSVVNGINKFPNQFTGGEGAVTGEEVLINVDFTKPVLLTADHYFFRPEALLTTGDLLFLSAAKPIVGGTGPFMGDLQSWIRNDDLAPDWLKIGTDITHQGPFNAAFSLSGSTVPEPSTWAMLATAIGALALARRKLTNHK
jgi:hypothetical protein